jgi:hypothetical protein
MADQAGPAPEGKGIPLWVIIGGVVAVAGFIYFRRKSSASGSTTTPLVPGVATDPNTGLPVDPLTGLPYITNPQQPQTNDSWASSALAWAEKNGIGAGLANQALFDYLNGNVLNGQEADIINKILSGFGNPPNLLPFQPPAGWGKPPVNPPNLLPHQPPKPPVNPPNLLPHQPPKPPVGTPKPHIPLPLPKINPGKYPQFISGILHPPLYKIPPGGDVVNGAPVYAIVNTGYGPVYEQGQAVQRALHSGGQLYTLQQFKGYVQPRKAA